MNKNKLLIITLADVSAYGVKCLSAYIRNRGRVADILCLRLSDTMSSFLMRKPGGQISLQTLDSLLSFIREYDCIGISLFSDGYHESVHITKKIKQAYPYKKVIWGGIHPTLEPETSLQWADYVCVGEGYYSLTSLLEQLDNSDSLSIETLPKGIWSKRGEGDVIHNGCSQVCLNLDTLPFPSNDAGSVYVRNNDDTISYLNRSNYRKYMDYVYYTMMSQGCPNSCTYCCNYALKVLSKEYSIIRKHSVEYILNEIKEAQKNYTFYNVYFMDDSFIMLDDESFDEFVNRYPREIGLPMIIIGFIPKLMQAKHVDKLVEAGMIRGRIGIQTGSTKMLNIYNRKQSNDDIIRASESFAKYKGKIVPTGCDFILDGYRETIEDTIETARLISKLKRPYMLNLSSLKSYPGTKIRQYISNYAPGDSYKNINNTFINFVISLMSLCYIPELLLNSLLNNKRLMGMRVPHIFSNILYYAILIRKAIYHFYYGDYSSKPFWLVDIVRNIKKISYKLTSIYGGGHKK